MESNYTGYSEWTITGYDLDKCTLGGHDINQILLSHIGEYANIRVECPKKGGVMRQMSKKPKFSICISDFCKMVDNAKNDYQWNKDEVNRLDRLTQDYLHMLELDGLDYKQRAKVATQIAKCRQERRASKDTAEMLEPLIQFLDSDKGRNMMNLMREVLGKTRKIEERMEKRTYCYKVYEPQGEKNE